jgi:hypothetical protein
MLAAILLVFLTLGLNHWLLEPLVAGLQPLLTASWLFWPPLLLLLWFFTGAAADD